ncbi:MAG: signal peptide peptidase SppA [Bacteroidales bacterium]|nr:signal peptide peptidase SppA [Bacteroidales bacterium]
MKEFFRTFFAVILAMITMNILAFFVAIFVIASLATIQSPKPIVQGNSVLVITLKDAIIDQSTSNKYAVDWLSGGFSMDKNLGLREVTTAIRNAANDPKIEGISLELSSTIPTSLALLEEIRTELENFKKSRKFIYAYSNSGFSQKGYYIASVANEIYLSPVAGFDLRGLCYHIPFFKDFFDKFNIEMQVIRHGKYKSAVEPYISNKMSEANREQTSSFVNATWNDFLKPISISRNISIEDLNRYADELSVTGAKQAKKLDFIDDIIYEDEYVTRLKKVAFAEADADKKLRKITLEKYIAAEPEKKSSDNDGYVAIVYAQGDIIEGKSTQSSMGNETICKALRDAREDKKVKAIVFRVNSPGGSALASEFILRELKLTVEEKPVIVSMGAYAASGGYYISCAANHIFADPTTLTGSIGVFGMVPNIQKLLKNDLKINFESVKTNKNADFMTTIFEPMSSYQIAVIQNQIEEIYDTFITHVAEGRNMTKEQVDEIAQGRVWTGTEAIAINLVDELGSLEDAIAFAAEKAELNQYKIKEFPRQKEFLEELLENLTDMTSVKLLKNNRISPFIEAMDKAATMQGIQARLPFVIIEGE